MTREEASKIIKDGIEDMSLDFADEEQYEALNMAIKALEQEPRKITYEDVKGYCKPRCLTIIDNELLYELTHPKIKALEQEPKTGHWEMCEDADGIYGVCDICGTDADFTHYGKAYPYCPNCGCRMVEQKESEKV